MFNRFGFALTVLLFGCLLFGIGFLIAKKTPASPTLPEESAEASILNDDDGAVDTSADQKDEPSLPVLGELLPGVAAAESQRYTLLLGQFVLESSAHSYAQSSKSVPPDLATLQVVDNQQRTWWLLTSGDYSRAEAGRASYELRVRHGLHSTLIKLPEAPDS